ncbi:cell wall hydrolase [Aurantimonas sp. HBX-1]|uniref:cell wall hydrolase n=1 Tax=Aurantimonas sp. HBX-1 TaxID=2906072 RepID=UPI001F1E1772|nr:cell wall hydrolase [Aurantimonas sp. HBX-1]UIJ72030.1 cell wall hydrolase [Aurantimonas sp. HBX-1]
MKTIRPSRRLSLSAIVLLPPLALAGCVGTGADLEEAVKPLSYGPSQECLARAMYFESNRSSESGMMAVGTVVMNRVESGEYPSDVCAVVAQPKQFAPGVMTRTMGAGKDLAMKTAYRVLSGERHEPVRDARFFHTAGLSFPYGNMHYTAIAGGNAFYEKVSRRHRPDFKHASQAEVAAAGASGAIDGMRQGASGATPAPVAAALKPVRKPAEASPFLALWNGLARKYATPARPAAEASTAPTTATPDLVAATAADAAPAANAALPGVTTAAPLPAGRPETPAEAVVAASSASTNTLAERGGRVVSPTARP